MNKFDNCLDYRHLERPIEMDGFNIIGFFPYETASVHPGPSVRRNKMPRSVARHIEDALMPSDNKIVVICKDTVNFGTNNFAVFLHDSGCVFGGLDEVTGYAGRELRIK